MSIDIAPGGGRRLTDRVAEEIRVMMVRKRVNGAQMAQKLGKSAAWVSYRLNGIQPIDLVDLEMMADALGVKPAQLMPTSEKPPTLRKVDALGARVIKTVGEPNGPPGPSDHAPTAVRAIRARRATGHPRRHPVRAVKV